MAKRSLRILFIVLIFIALMPGYSGAASNVRIEVKIILATQKKGPIDPRLQGLTRDLQSVLRYSSYELLGSKNINLATGGTGRVALPDNGVLKIVSRGIDGNRVILDIEILRNNSSVIHSVIKLRNNDRTTIGGSEYRGGKLLLNIFASF